MGAGAGHHLGRVYLAWVRLSVAGQFAYAAYSDDGGATWQKGPTGPGFPTTDVQNVPLYPRPLGMPNGDLAGVQWNANARAPAPHYVGRNRPPGDATPLPTPPSHQAGRRPT